MEAEQVAQLIERLGLAIVILGFILLALWKSGKYLGIRLFGEDKGIVTKVSDKYVEFVDTVQKQGDVTNACLQKLTESNLAQQISQDKLHRAFEHHGNAMVEIAGACGGTDVRVKVNEHVERAKRELDK